MRKSLFSVLLFFTASCFGINQTGRLDHNGLFTILEHYKKIAGNWHRGDLLDHMVWVSKSMDQMFENNSWWLHGIDSSERRLMVLSAFMHDIGKAGDLEFEYRVKRTHPLVGFEYILGKRPFYISENETWNVQEWLEHHELTDYEIKTLAVLVGMHQELGKVLFAFKNAPSKWASVQEKFFDTLLYYVQESGYNNGIPDERIIIMCAAICRSDGEGLHYVNYESKTFPELPNLPEKHEAHRPIPVSLVDVFGIPFFFYRFLPYCLKKAEELKTVSE